MKFVWYLLHISNGTLTSELLLIIIQASTFTAGILFVEKGILYVTIFTSKRTFCNIDVSFFIDYKYYYDFFVKVFECFFFLLAPSFGPDNFITTELNETTFNISWAPLPTEKNNGIVVLYEANAELVATRGCSRRTAASSKGVNTTKTFAVLYNFLTCSQYSFSVRAFTAVGPGPYGPATQLQTSSK